MLRIRQTFLACALTFVFAFMPAALANDFESLADRYVAMAIQGDLSGALELFEAPFLEREPAAAELKARFEARFYPPADTNSPDRNSTFTEKITDAYRRYWRRTLMGSPVDTNISLDTELAALIEMTSQAIPEGQDVYDALNGELAKRRIRFYGNPDPPMRDLFLWKEETLRRYQVRLTDTTLRLTVHFMDEFLLRGWKEYASLGLATTTGWVDGGELFCLAGAYETGSERFEVSYLKHEARHLADLERFPEMESVELEYRSKLTELAFADRSLVAVLEDFAVKAAENPGSPHAMANWRVVRDVYWALRGEEMPEGFNSWGGVSVSEVNRVAKGLLELNTEVHER